MAGVSTERSECTVSHTVQVKNEETARKLLIETFRLADIEITVDTFDRFTQPGAICGYPSSDNLLTAAKKLKIKGHPANLVTIERLSLSEYPHMLSWKVEGRLSPKKPTASVPVPKAKLITHEGVRVKML